MSLKSLGFSTLKGVDVKTKRWCALAYNRYGSEESWGWYLKDTTGPIKLLLEAPHPVADFTTENIALDVWRRVPGCFLMVAGAHRQAGGEGGTGDSQGLADPPWNSASMFNKVTAHFMPLPQLQIHGFADANQPDFDIVLATGSAPTNDLVVRLADALDATGLRVARYWEGDSDIYGAVGNEQSKLALAHDGDFVHLEMNYTVRTTPELKGAVVGSIAAMI